MCTFYITCTAHAHTFLDTQVPSLILSWKKGKTMFKRSHVYLEWGKIVNLACFSESEVSLASKMLPQCTTSQMRDETALNP